MNYSQLKNIFQDWFDVVIDFIAFTPADIEKDFQLYKSKTKQFIFISSTTVYKRDFAHYIYSEESDVGNPFSNYAQNKLACENLLFSYFYYYNFPITIIRPSDTYDNRTVPIAVHGNHGIWQVLKRMQNLQPVIIHGDGNSRWTVTHSIDFAKLFLPIIGCDTSIGQIIQVTSDEHYSWNEIYHEIARALGCELKPYYISSQTLAKYGEKFHFKDTLLGDAANNSIFNNKKLKQFNKQYQPQIDLKTGIKTSVANIMLSSKLQVNDEEFDKWCEDIIKHFDSF